MTTLDETLREATAPTAPSAATGLWARTEAWLLAAGDRLNPILVKETRQALKSRQFLITFSLLLIGSWCWSIFGTAMIGWQEIRYGAYGTGMFAGYFIGLWLPLSVIVPFGAFRSLAGEREDGTHDLLSITTLKPRQIVSGKLGSAVVQMMVYFSALAPCLAFTYLLRGVDLLTIAFILAYSVLASLGLAMCGLLLATLTTQKHWQAVLSVGIIACLGWVFFMGSALVIALLENLALPFQEEGFWQVNGVILTAYASYFVLLYVVTAARLTFASDNRSTAARVAMLAQQVLFVGWVAWLVTFLAPSEVYDDVTLIMLMLAFINWIAMGAFMIGESADLSHRVRRRLPQSFFGRAFLTWFNPGPGTGYVFAVANYLSLALLACSLLVVLPLFFSAQFGVPSRTEGAAILYFTSLSFLYLVFYLGLARIVLRGVRRFARPSPLLAPLVVIVLVTLGTLVPLTAQEFSRALRGADYTVLQATNPIWTLAEIVDNNMFSDDLMVVGLTLAAAAGVVALLNVPSIAAEVRQVRTAAPPRVAEEDAERAAVAAPAPVPKSPWDV